MQLGILIETMRREGYELSISRPRVIMREDPETGKRQEPIEEVVVDVDDAYSGVVVEALTTPQGRAAGNAAVRRRHARGSSSCAPRAA